IDVAVAPGGHGHQHAIEVAALVGQGVFVAGRMLVVEALFQYAVADQAFQPRGQHVAGDAQPLLPLLETPHVGEGVAQNEEGPGVADHLQGGRYGADLPRIVRRASHGRDVARALSRRQARCVCRRAAPPFKSIKRTPSWPPPTTPSLSPATPAPPWAAFKARL